MTSFLSIGAFISLAEHSFVNDAAESQLSSAVNHSISTCCAPALLAASLACSAKDVQNQWVSAARHQGVACSASSA